MKSAFSGAKRRKFTHIFKNARLSSKKIAVLPRIDAAFCAIQPDCSSRTPRETQRAEHPVYALARGFITFFYRV